MAKTPKAKGKNGELTYYDVTEAFLAWIDEEPILTVHLSEFLSKLPDDVEFTSLQDLAGNTSGLGEVIFLSHLAAHSDERAMAEKLQQAWNAVEFPKFSDRSVRDSTPVIAALLTADALEKHGLDASDAASKAKERLDILVDFGVRMPAVFDALLFLGLIDEALELHRRRRIPWDIDKKKEGNRAYYYRGLIRGVTAKIVAALWKRDRMDDAKALIKRCEEPSSPGADDEHSWDNIFDDMLSLLPERSPEVLEFFRDVGNERIQSNIIPRMIQASLPELAPELWRYRAREDMEHPLLDDLRANARLHFGDARGFREHFSPHEGVVYTEVKYRSGMLTVDEAIAETRENLANSLTRSPHIITVVQMLHEALDRKNIDEAHRFLELLDDIFAGTDFSHQYDQHHKDDAFCNYTVAKARILMIQGEQKEAQRLLKAAIKRAKAGGEYAVQTLVSGDLSFNLPHLAAAAAMKLPLKDRKKPSIRAQQIITRIATAYLPEDPAGALYTIDKVAGTPEAKVLIMLDALDHM